MAIRTVVTNGMGNGTFSGTIALVVTDGYAIGEPPAEPAPCPYYPARTETAPSYSSRVETAPSYPTRVEKCN